MTVAIMNGFFKGRSMDVGIKKWRGWFAWTGWIVFLVLCLVACDKEPQERKMIVGPWKDTIASYHTIISFRANGSFGTIRLVEGQHSKIDDTGENTKVDGKWQLLTPEVEGDPLLLVMTPEVVEGETHWEVDAPVTYLIERLTLNRMLLRSPTGERISWDRLRSTKALAEEEDGIPRIRVATGPLVVGLTKDRLNEDNRYLCVQLEVVIIDVEGTAYVEEMRLPSGDPSGGYRLHPCLREALVLHMSRLKYRDVRSLNHFRDVLKDFKRILSPYLGDHLSDLKLVKIIVTKSQDGVDSFVAEFTPKGSKTPADDS